MRGIFAKILGLFYRPKEHRDMFVKMVRRESLKHILTTYKEYHNQPTEFKYNLSLTMCVKDEREYIIEFIEYYLLQGVNHFYIYNNNGTDDTKELIKSYIEKGIVSWIEYPGTARRTQEDIYNHAINHYKNETKWMIVVDADEFIVPLKHKSIAEFLEECDGFSQILLYWVNYGSSGHKEKTDGLVIERFTKHQQGTHISTKVIVNPRAVASFIIHQALVWGDTVNERKEKILFKKKAFDNTPSSDILRVNHYIVKSYEEWSNKAKSRQQKSGFDQIDETYFYKNDVNDVEDNIMLPFVDKIKSRIKSQQI